MAAVQPLLDWAAALPGGAVSAKICAGTGDGAARTLVAAEDLPAGEVMVQLPLGKLLHRDSAEADPLLGEAFTALREKDGANELASLSLYLACLTQAPRGALGGRWAAYIEALPAQCPTPLGWGEAEIALLAATPLRAALQQQVDVANELVGLWWPKLLARVEATGAQPAVKDALRGCGRPAVLHAYSMVASRAFAVLFPDGSTPLTLIPLVDMLDHSCAVQVEYKTSQSADGDIFQLVAKSAQPKGQQLWINYGSSKSNSELLIQHGFAVPSNPADRFTSNLRMRAPDQDEPATDLDILLRSVGLSLEQQLSADDPLPNSLLHVLALLHLPPQCAYYLAARILETADAEPSEIGTPRFAGGGSGGSVLASPFRRISRDGGYDPVAVSSPRKRVTPMSGTRRPKKASPLFSSVVLMPSFGANDMPLPLVQPVTGTLNRLLTHEVGRCEAVATADGVPGAEEARALAPTGSTRPAEALSLYLAGQVGILHGALTAASEWAERMSGLADFVASAPSGASGPSDSADTGLWHELHLEVPERARLLILSGLGTNHWLPLLEDGDNDDPATTSAEGSVSMVPSSVADICWNRLLSAASVCSADLSELEHAGAPALLEAAARLESTTAGPRLGAATADSGSSFESQSMEAAAEAFRKAVSQLPSHPEQGQPQGDERQTPEMLLQTLLEDELAQVERWAREQKADLERLSDAAAKDPSLAAQLEEATEDLAQLSNSAAVLASWTFRLGRITRLQRKSSFLNSRKRRRTVG